MNALKPQRKLTAGRLLQRYNDIIIYDEIAATSSSDEDQSQQPQQQIQTIEQQLQLRKDLRNVTRIKDVFFSEELGLSQEWEALKKKCDELEDENNFLYNEILKIKLFIYLILGGILEHRGADIISAPPIQKVKFEYIFGGMILLKSRYN